MDFGCFNVYCATGKLFPFGFSHLHLDDHDVVVDDVIILVFPQIVRPEIVRLV